MEWLTNDWQDLVAVLAAVFCAIALNFVCAVMCGDSFADWWRDVTK